jgi:archaellum component FlaC
MKNEKLQELIDTHTGKSNKDLANVLLTLKADFENIKKTIIELTETLEEVEVTYDHVYNELQKRLKFKDTDES